MKFFLSLFFATTLCKFAFASTLVEFDSRDLEIGPPIVEGKSLDLWVTYGARKISENVYKDPGGCGGCTFMQLNVKYVINIPLKSSRTIQLPGLSSIWSELTDWHPRVYTIPAERLNFKMNDDIVMDSIAQNAQNSLDYLSDVRRGTVFFDANTKTCYIKGIRGTYNSQTLKVTSFETNTYLSKCP